MLHRAKDLSPDQRIAVEALLAGAVSSDEAVSVRAFAPPTVIPSTLTPEQRAEALARLDGYFAKVNAARKPVTEEEEEAIITEAIRSVRPGYRPAG